MTEDIRWIQRLSNFSKALRQLEEGVELSRRRTLNDLEKQGVIQAFEFTHELAWNVLKDFYEYQGETGIQGSRDAVRLAFRRGLLKNGDAWMEMIQNRNRTTHTYNRETMEQILAAVTGTYLAEFQTLESHLQEQRRGT